MNPIHWDQERIYPKSREGLKELNSLKKKDLKTSKDFSLFILHQTMVFIYYKKIQQYIKDVYKIWISTRLQKLQSERKKKHKNH